MALPTGKHDARTAYETMVQMRSDILAQTASARQVATISGGPVAFFVRYHEFLMGIAPRWNALKDVDGLVAYVKERENDPNFDVVAGYNAVLATGTACVVWIRQNLPNDGSGNIANWTLTNGRMQQKELSVADLSGLVTLLDDLIAAVG